MTKLNLNNDTIAAISTAIGQGGIGIVRLSGKDSIKIADSIFKPKSGKKLQDAKTFSVHYGCIIKKINNQDEVIDEVLVTVMRSPKSYTTEDVVEISSHGGIVPLKAILDFALDSGARLAEPGEFTKRAFLNGRIDLVQAEAVLDIIQSKTDSFLKVSTNQLKGGLSLELEKIRESLMEVYVKLEAEINFPDEDIDTSSKEKIKSDVENSINKIRKLILSGEQGIILKEGIKIVICGKPNVGKSSLLNVFLETPRAIVSEIAGTTRDTIHETAQINGISFQFVDTAGILNPRDIIEEEAVKRSRMNIESADIVLMLFDVSKPIADEDEKFILEVKNKNKLFVLNKCDLGPAMKKEDIKKIDPEAQVLSVSALNKTGIDKLKKMIIKNVWQGKTLDTHGILVTNVRHIQSLKSCKKILENVNSVFEAGAISSEFISEDIKSAINYLDNITGKNIDIDLLDNIFSQFCIGK